MGSCEEAAAAAAGRLRGERADLSHNLRVCIAGFTRDLKRLSSLLIRELVREFFHLPNFV